MLNFPDLTGWGVTRTTMLTPEISQTDRQGRSLLKVAPWLARCYPFGQIPRISHGFYEAARGI